MADKLTAREIRDQFTLQREKLQRILKSEDGKEALAYLKSKYGGDVVTSDPYLTHVRVGEKRVIEYLQMLREEPYA
jgi:hypothetical protein